MTNIVRKIDPGHPVPGLIAHAAAVIKQGGVVMFPTHGLYGLGADAFNAEAVDRIFKIKQRPAQKPILILIDDLMRLEQLATTVGRAARLIMAHFWPGRVTLVFEAVDSVPAHLTAGTGKIGIRLPGHPVAAALVKAVGGPITGTSANISGRPGCRRIGDLEPEVAGRLDLILDAGLLKGGSGSTVVDVTADSPQILREGEVSAREILTLLGGEGRDA